MRIHVRDPCNFSIEMYKQEDSYSHNERSSEIEIRNCQLKFCKNPCKFTYSIAFSNVWKIANVL